MHKFLRKVEILFIFLSILCLAIMMVVTSYDAIARYAWNRPLSWSFQLITFYFLVAAMYFALSETFVRGDHINLDIFRNRLTQKIRAKTDILWIVPGIVVLAAISVGSFIEMKNSFASGSFIPGAFRWPAWVSYLPVVLGTGLMAIRLLRHGYMLLVFGHDPAVAETGEAER